MKQNITVEQLKEIKGNARRKLNKWWEKHYFNKIIEGSTDGDGWAEGLYFDPVLNIGQMIEFLDEHIGWWSIIREEVNIFVGEKPKDWEGIFSVNFDNHHTGTSLCDTLWEAVKEVLNTGEK